MAGKRIGIGKVNAAILDGTEDLSLWSDEELRRGQRKSKNGRWEGRPPAVVPKKLHDELVKRTLDEAADVLRDNLVDAVTLLGRVVRDGDASNAERIKAAELIMKHALPKEPLTVKVDLGPTFEDMLVGAVAHVDDEQAIANPVDYDRDNVLEGELVDESYEPDAYISTTDALSSSVPPPQPTTRRH